MFLGVRENRQDDFFGNFELARYLLGAHAKLEIVEDGGDRQSCAKDYGSATLHSGVNFD